MKRKHFLTTGIFILVMIFLSLVLLSTSVFAASNSLSDDFNSLNTNWEKSDGWTNGNPFNCTWRSSNVNFTNGQMNLSITKDSGSVPYAGGEYRTKNFYGYGKYEVSMKPAKNTGIVSSFFTYTGSSDNNPWDEIDIEFWEKTQQECNLTITQMELGVMNIFTN